MAVNELEILKRTEELLYRIYPTLVNYPKAEKFALCENIKQNFYDMIKYISMGNSVKSKRAIYLQEADGHLQTLKILFKLSKNQKYISKGFFKDVDLEFTHINMMLSSYIKSTRK